MPLAENTRPEPGSAVEFRTPSLIAYAVSGRVIASETDRLEPRDETAISWHIEGREGVCAALERRLNYHVHMCLTRESMLVACATHGTSSRNLRCIDHPSGISFFGVALLVVHILAAHLRVRLHVDADDFHVVLERCIRRMVQYYLDIENRCYSK